VVVVSEVAKATEAEVKVAGAEEKVEEDTADSEVMGAEALG
jgi:hypothetical protein